MCGKGCGSFDANRLVSVMSALTIGVYVQPDL